MGRTGKAAGLTCAVVMATGWCGISAWAQENGVVQLDPVTVEGQAAQTSETDAWAPVQGYNAKRSATGSKTDAEIKDIPQSINVVPRQVLEDQGAGRLADAVSNMPNAQASGSAGNRSEAFIFRGFTTSSYAIDGMSLNPALETTDVLRDFANIERVELLKGPGSVLYGRGDPGGVLNLITRRPTKELSADGKVQVGSGEFRRAETGVSGAIDAQAGLYFRMDMGTQSERGQRGYLRDSKQTLLAPTLMWEPDDRTRVRLGLQYNDQIRPYDRGLVVVNGSVLNRSDLYYGEDWSKSAGHKTDLDMRIEHDVNDWLTLRQNSHFDWARLSRLSADPVAVSGATLTRRVNDQHDDTNNTDLQFEALAKFQTGPLAHQALVGAEYLHARRSLLMWRASLGSVNVYTPSYGARAGAYSLNTTRTDAMDVQSAYWQDQIDLGRHWKLIGGMRFDQVDQSQNRWVTGTATYRTVHKDARSGRVGLVYQPVEALSLYGSYAESFQPQFASVKTGEALPETGQQREIGAKLDITPKLSATLSAFRIFKQNVSTTDPTDSSYVVLTGEQKSEGVEFTLNGEILPGWDVMAGLGFVDAVINKDSTYQTGSRIAAVSPITASLWSVYHFQDGPLKGLGLGGGVLNVGRRMGDQTHSYQVGGYTRVDAMASYDLTDALRLSLNVRNLFDREYIETPVSTTENYVGEPLNAMLTLSVKY